MRRVFSARIYKEGINPCVDVPPEIITALRDPQRGERGPIPVQGSLNGHPSRATLMPTKGGMYRLYINGEMRRAAGVDEGDEIDLALEFDPLPRDLPVPEALGRALDENPAARAAFEALTPSRRKEILAYLGSLKQPESIQRNVDRLVSKLTD
jgi:hypothetical protein